MVKKILKYIYLDNGEYLYDESTQKVYTFSRPSKFVGFLQQLNHDPPAVQSVHKQIV